MKLNYNQFLAVVYADLFDFPLTKQEISKWSVSGKGKGGSVEVRNGLYFLPGRGKLVELRKQREIISEGKEFKLLPILRTLQEIPSIEAIFVTGSLAVNNASVNSDIDLMIITKPGTLWKTRLKILLKLKFLKKLRDGEHVKDRICTNMFLDLGHLEIKERNLYTAHEIVQAKCVFDRGGIQKAWIFENRWVGEFLPQTKIVGKTRKITKNSFSLLEIGAFLIQYLYMKPKITNEKVGFGFAFFHPVNGSEYFLARFQKRLAVLAGMR